MIIVCFGNGLGNQMFQYAFYLALKKRYPDVEIKMDINYMQDRAHNGFELERIFHVPVYKCSRWETQRLAKTWPGYGKMAELIRKLYRGWNRIFPSGSHIRYADGTVYHPEVFKLESDRNYLLDGTWINELYFRKVKDEVLEAFQFHVELNERNQKYLDEIRKSNSVSLHIRRGDYMQVGFYILTPEYYQAAVNTVKKSQKNIKIFVFTDDMEWVKNKMYFADETVFVEGNSAPDNYIDMYLMSQCKHNIIANSSFSFWGAYLNRNPQKVVVAPNRLERRSQEGIISREKGWEIIDILPFLNGGETG